MLTSQMRSEQTLVNTNQQIRVRYTNYRGETAIRTIVPICIFWGKTEFHPEEQWLLEVFDVERDATRLYAFRDIKEILR